VSLIDETPGARERESAGGLHMRRVRGRLIVTDREMSNPALHRSAESKVANIAHRARRAARQLAILSDEQSGGTSAEAIYQMEKGSLRTVLSKAVWAAYQRTVALWA